MKEFVRYVASSVVILCSSMGSLIAAVSASHPEGDDQGIAGAFAKFGTKRSLMTDNAQCNTHAGLIAGLSTSDVSFSTLCQTEWKRAMAYNPAYDEYYDPRVYLYTSVLLKVPASVPENIKINSDQISYFVTYSIKGQTFYEANGLSSLENCRNYLGWFSSLSTDWISLSGKCQAKDPKNEKGPVDSSIWVRAKINVAAPNVSRDTK